LSALPWTVLVVSMSGPCGSAAAAMSRRYATSLGQ
jgi:hypothetical protein